MDFEFLNYLNTSTRLIALLPISFLYPCKHSAVNFCTGFVIARSHYHWTDFTASRLVVEWSSCETQSVAFVIHFNQQLNVSILDGANDVAMIQEADVTLFLHEAYTLFSGQPFYNDWAVVSYNVLFTSLPVIAMGVFNQDVRFCSLLSQGIVPTTWAMASILVYHYKYNTKYNWSLLLTYCNGDRCSSRCCTRRAPRTCCSGSGSSGGWRMASPVPCHLLPHHGVAAALGVPAVISQRKLGDGDL